MKNFIILFLFVNVLSTAQTSINLDTIYANDHMNVALFFSEPIKQGIAGSNNFVFTYNREKEGYFGLLQATPGKESNLLVVSRGGSVFSYILKYKNRLSKLNYFIPKTESIGTSTPKFELPERGIIKSDSITRDLVYFKNFGDYLLKLKPKNLKTKREKGLKLKLQRLAYNGSETYLIIEITNHSGITFEIDFLNVFRVSGNKKRNASYQKLIMKPIYTHKMPSKVYNNQSCRFVYVLPKFVLGKQEKLQLELQEFNGSRKLKLLSGL